MRERGQDRCHGNRRRGSVLVIVLVVVVLLALAAYNYSQLMLTELEAAGMHTSDAQARMMTDSAAEYVATLLANRAEPGLENLQHNPQLFQGISVIDSPQARGRGRFSIIAPLEQDPLSTRIRYGLMDESARLNLNVLNKLQLDETESRTLLMGLPGMTEEIADAILDWIDVDDNARLYGAEAEYYESETAYSTKNGPLETIDELLLVRGVTPELLYGEDANRNGLLDITENDADFSPPLDNADGILQHGWIAFLTVHSRESNLRADGRKKIDINNGLLTDLYAQLLEEFDEEVANYIIQYRIAGPKDPPLPPDPNDPNSTTGSSSSGSSGSGGSSGGGSSGGGRGGGSGGSGGSSGGGKGSTQSNTLSPEDLGNAAGALMAGSGPVSVGPYEAKGGGPNKIDSIWHLFESTAKPAPAAKGASTTQNTPEMTSPLTADTATVLALLDALTTTTDPFREGRININQARREVLVGIPYMTTELIDAILAAQTFEEGGELSTGHDTTYWLYTQQLVDLPTLRALDRYITARGDVYRAQALGFYDGGGPVSRAEVIIDATQQPPRIVFHRDLNDLGRGYTRAQIFAPATE